ncbi:MAG: urease accessory protein UreE [Saccharospirillaceae bacterium]|nr:hypothetical protein [Pseudomonadales bacterium]NRB80618.1 urease accessory protein UreE [Saccharospirillaceae bacterium]
MSVIEITKVIVDHCHGEIQGVIELTYDERKKARLKTKTTDGIDLGLFLPRGNVLPDGCIVATKNDQYYKIKAKKELIMQATTDDWVTFSTVCYHLGNRHLTLEIQPLTIIFQPDHVLADLCKHYNFKIIETQLPFNPLNGAYGEFGGHSHNDGLDHSAERTLANKVTDEHKH